MGLFELLLHLISSLWGAKVDDWSCMEHTSSKAVPLDGVFPVRKTRF